MNLNSAVDPAVTEELQILIVEDVAVEAEIAARHLRKQGIQCHIHCVATEAEFLRALSEHPPHLILSDYTLSDVDGVRALNLAMAHAPDVPFIFVSGTIDALRRGATDYVLKDNLARLGPAVERALREVRDQVAKRDAEHMLRDIVDNPHDRSIVATIIQLAKQFSMSTVAEGVETDEQLSCLREMRCDQAQGYLLSKPVTSAGITQRLREADYS